jgi:uncharacterized protein
VDLTGRVAGVDLTSWVAGVDLAGRAVDRLLGLPRPRARRLLVQRDLQIPMADGVLLRADRYRPIGDDGPMPVVLVRTPYQRRGLNGQVLGAAMARQGFQVVLQSVRGTFGSGGSFAGFRQERDDGLATAAWLRAQPWCDGRLAMAGASYLGYTQWALAPYLDPPLVAMCPGITASDLGRSRGAFALSHTLSWVSLLARQESAPLGGLLPSRRRARRFETALRHLPVEEADVVAIGAASAVWRALLSGDAADDHSAAVATVHTPVSMVTGWYDHQLPWQLRDFLALPDGRKRITIGPWAHGDLATAAAQAQDQVSWLREHLDGAAAPRRSPVRAYLQHADQWLDLDGWPTGGAQRQHLTADGRLAAEPSPAACGGFDYDPADPTPVVGGPDTARRQADNRPVEARPDVLTFTGDPLTTDLDLVGDVRAVVRVRAAAGASLFVRLCDVAPDGRSLNVSDGIAAVDAGPATTVPMWPTAYRMRRGHRIRVQVAGGAFPRYARNPGPSRYEVSGGHVDLPVRPPP